MRAAISRKIRFRGSAPEEYSRVPIVGPRTPRIPNSVV